MILQNSSQWKTLGIVSYEILQCKQDWIQTSDSKGVISVLIQIVLQSWLYWISTSDVDFVTPAGKLKRMKKHFPLQEMLLNQRHPAEVLNSDFNLCPRSKPLIKMVWLIQKIFLHKLPKVSDILNENKIGNMADTFLDMAADSPIPVVSKKHSICINNRWIYTGRQLYLYN